MVALHQTMKLKRLFQTVEAEIAAIEKNIERVKKQIAAAKHAAETGTPVAGENGEEAKASAEGDPDPTKKKTVVTTESNLPKGIGFYSICSCKNVGMPCSKAR